MRRSDLQRWGPGYHEIWEPTLLCSLLWCVHAAIPVGIAVARQRLQDHMPPSGTKPDMKPPQAATCRQQKPLAPAPPEPQCSAADLVAAPAPPSLSAMGKLNRICVCVCEVLYRLFKTANTWAIFWRGLGSGSYPSSQSDCFNGTASCSDVCSRASLFESRSRHRVSFIRCVVIFFSFSGQTTWDTTSIRSCMFSSRSFPIHPFILLFNDRGLKWTVNETVGFARER